MHRITSVNLKIIMLDIIRKNAYHIIPYIKFWKIETNYHNRKADAWLPGKWGR